MRRLSDSEFVAHFWERVDRNGPTQPHMDSPCWVWTGCINTGGYGSLYWRKRPLTAHRVAWELQNGPIPEGLCVLHHCDHRACVRHTYVGTKKANSDDMYRRGRGNKARGDRNGSRAQIDKRPRGEAHGLTTLTSAQVREMRERYAAGGVRMRDLAADYGIWSGSVSRIIRRETWGHVD